MANQIETTCALCQSPLNRAVCVDEGNVYCCAGCQAVHAILSSRQVSQQLTEHPLFLNALKSGLISNPDLVDQARQQQRRLDLPDGEFHKLLLEINDMWCPSCADVIRLILIKEKGVKHCVVDYSTDLASIEYAPRYLSKEKIFRLIEKLGYRPALLEDPRRQATSRTLYARFIVAAFFSLNIMMFAYPIYASYFHLDSGGYAKLFSWLSLIGAIPVLTYSAWPIWRRLIVGLRVGVWGMEVLVFLGVLAGTALSLYELWHETYYVYFDSMTVIIVFVLLGKIIESKAKFSAKDSLLGLARALPRRGRKLFADGTEAFVPLKELELGSFFISLTGEKIVLDGVVEKGTGSCDESLMTGESFPVVKTVGSTVLGGSLLRHGRLVVKVTAKPEETALQCIMKMVEQDIGHKSIYTRASDPIVKWFVPIVLILAVGTGLHCILNDVLDGGYTAWETAMIRAISILLISCPCAIGIAAPLAESHLLNALAKLGAIVRNRGCLFWLGKETTFVFDKTGTITEGKFAVLKGMDLLCDDKRAYLKGLVLHSTHPIAAAINDALVVPSFAFDSVEEIIGRGLKGRIGEDAYYLGSSIFLKQEGVEQSFLSSNEEETLTTRVWFAKNKTCLTAFVLGDRIKSDAAQVIQALSSEGVKTLVVSGDGSRSVEKVATHCRFTNWHANYHPLQKQELINQLKRTEIVAMIGDGINDAPALTAAHVSIAVVSATAISIQVSDLLLTTDRLPILLKIRQLANKGHRIIKQNLFWAFFYNVIGIGLAMTGRLSPLFAAFAMVASSLIVLFNAQRIRVKN